MDFLHAIIGSNANDSDFKDFSPGTNYIIPRYYTSKYCKAVIILTNGDSIKYVTNDILKVLRDSVYIDAEHLKIGDNSIIGAIYNIKQSMHIDKYLYDLTCGDSSLILNAFHKNLDNYDDFVQTRSAIKQILAMNPKRSAFLIFNEEYSSKVDILLSIFEAESYTIIKE